MINFSEALAELDPNTASLVLEFATAVAEKLALAKAKYGYTNEWEIHDWESSCKKQFAEHVEKGDPRDVAAYCAFMWYHGWSTEPIRNASSTV